MDQSLHIRASCIINKHHIKKDLALVYEEGGTTDAGNFLMNAYRHFSFNYPRFYKMDNLSKLGWLCTELLVTNDNQHGEVRAGRLLRHLPPESVAVLLCNASSSLDTDHRYFTTVSEMASPALFVYTLPNIVIGEICIRNGFKGENLFFITKTFDADFIKTQVEYVMNDPQNLACICGWVELLDNEYKAALYLIERNNNSQNPTFTTGNIQRIFES